MTQARLIISLDCEGKWGVADHLAAHHDRHFTRDNLLDVYRKLVELFGRHGVTATFAFVGAFVSSPAKVADVIRDLPDDAFTARWFGRLRRDLDHGRLDGWFLPEAIDIVRAGGTHEIAGHGFTHLPFIEGLMSVEWAHRELAELRATLATRGAKLQTLVFPRNIGGFRDLLPQHGVIGYRHHPPPRAARRSLAGQWQRQVAPLQAAERPQAGVPQPIPLAHFVNWRFGLRAIVPKAHVVARFRRLIDDAISRGAVAHCYLHPHNVIDGSGQLDMLDGILRHFAERRRRGEIVCVTQQQFCEELRAADAAGHHRSYADNLEVAHSRVD